MSAVRGWSRFAVVMLGVALAASTLLIVAEAGRLDVIARIDDPANPTTLDQANASDAVVGIAAAGWLLAFVVTVVAFIGWLHAAAKQVERVQPNLLRYSTGWAIGGWFVPFLNLVRPVQIVNDVRRLGAPGALHDRKALVGWWWGLLIATNVVAVVVLTSGAPVPGDLDALRGDTIAQIVRLLGARDRGARHRGGGGHDAAGREGLGGGGVERLAGVRLRAATGIPTPRVPPARVPAARVPAARFPQPGYAQAFYPPPAPTATAPPTPYSYPAPPPPPPPAARRRRAGRRRARGRVPSHPSDAVRRWRTGLVCDFPDHQLGGGVP